MKSDEPNRQHVKVKSAQNTKGLQQSLGKGAGRLKVSPIMLRA